MKKLIGLTLLAVSFLFTGTALSQNRDYQRHAREYSQQHDQGRHRGWYNHGYRDNDYRMQTWTEYRYVQYWNSVYKETYRVTSVGGRIYRDLISRERVRDYDRNKLRFNVFLRF
jgi:hypothetical protein